MFNQKVSRIEFKIQNWRPKVPVNKFLFHGFESSLLLFLKFGTRKDGIIFWASYARIEIFEDLYKNVLWYMKQKMILLFYPKKANMNTYTK